MSQSHRLTRTAGPCSTLVARTRALAGSAATLAATLLLVTACSESTAPVAARPIAGANSGLIRVATTGLATAAGTTRDPMTLEQAVAVAPAGATIELGAGTYQTGNLVITRPVTIRPAGDAKVVLSGSTVIPGGQWQAMGNAWRTPWNNSGVPTSGGMEKMQGTTMTVARTTAAVAEEVKNEHNLLVQSLGGADEYAAHQHMAFLDGRAMQRVSSIGDVKPGTFYVDTGAHWLYIGQNPGGHEVALSASAVGMLLTAGNTRVTGMTLEHYTCYGIYIEQGNGIIIAGNVVHDNADGIGVHFTQNGYVYNNTVLNNGEDLDISAWEVQTNDLKNAKVVNNIIWNAKNAVMMNLYRAAGCNSATYSEVDYNAYYRPSGSAAKDVVNWCNDYFTSVSAFHSKTGYEAHGLEMDGGSDPFFASVWTENYHLKSGSKAINAGQPLPSNIAAALGWRAGVAVSMGALQN